MAFSSTSCIVSSASSRCPQTVILNEYTVFWRSSSACSICAELPDRNNSNAFMTSDRIARTRLPCRSLVCSEKPLRDAGPASCNVCVNVAFIPIKGNKEYKMTHSKLQAALDELERLCDTVKRPKERNGTPIRNLLTQ